MMEMPICMHTNGERYRGRKAEGTEGGGKDWKEGKLKEKIGNSSQFKSILSAQPLIRYSLKRASKDNTYPPKNK
jgi:hypothetical protein